MLRDIFSIGFVTLMLSAVFYTLIVDIYGIGSPLRDSYSANQMILKRSKSATSLHVQRRARFIACE